MSAISQESVITAIRQVTKGFGTDDKLLIETILSVRPSDLAGLDHHYKANYGKTAAEAIESDTSGNFGKLLAGCLQDQAVFAAHYLHNAMAGMGTDEAMFVELLTGRTNAELIRIAQAYQAKFGKSLEEAVKKEFSGNSQKFYVILLQASRDERGEFTNVDADVESFYKAGAGKIGTDETEFIRLIVNRNVNHLKRVFSAYAQKHGYTMDHVIKKEFSGLMEKILRSDVGYIESPGEFFAEQLESAMAGVGTNESKLKRIVIRIHGTPMMAQVKEAYLKKHGKTLEKRVHGETSGDFQKLLIALINQPVM